MFKKRAWIFLLLVVVLALGGCGKKASKTGEADFTSNGEVYKENGLPKDKKVTIRAIYPVAGFGKEHFEAAVRTFQEKFPNVTVDVRYIEAGQVAYYDIINSMLQSGDEEGMYDWIYSFKANTRDTLIEQGKLEPQDEMWERPMFDNPKYKLKDVAPVDKRDAFSRDDHMYKLPSSTTILGLYYDKKVLRKHGFEEHPANWQQFMDLCAKIKATGVYPLVMDGKHASEYFDFGWGTIPYSVGGDKYKDDVYYYKPNVFISKPYITMLKRLDEFCKKGYLHPGTVSFDHTQSQMEFIQGKAAMITNGTWISNEMKDVVPADFEWGFMPFPGNDPGQKQVLILYSGGNGYIWKNKPKLVKQWAKEFSLWLLNLDIQTALAKSGGIPSRIDFMEDPERAAALSPSARVALEVIKKYDLELVNNKARHKVINNTEMSKLGKVRGDNYVALVNGRKTPEEAAKAINDQYMKGLNY